MHFCVLRVTAVAKHNTGGRLRYWNKLDGLFLSSLLKKKNEWPSKINSVRTCDSVYFKLQVTSLHTFFKIYVAFFVQYVNKSREKCGFNAKANLISSQLSIKEVDAEFNHVSIILHGIIINKFNTFLFLILLKKVIQLVQPKTPSWLFINVIVNFQQYSKLYVIDSATHVNKLNMFIYM